MITRNYIQELKQRNSTELYHLLRSTKDSRDLLFILENLGHLPDGFGAEAFTPLLTHSNDSVRLWTVKNLGKVSDTRQLGALLDIARNDANSMVRREAASSIGRMRSRQGIPPLIQLLGDSDPKVVLQAIRGLLVFRDEAGVRRALSRLADHPNEMIQSIIRREFTPEDNLAELHSHRERGQAHPLSPDFMRNVVVHGDVRDVLRYAPDESVHLTFTSPPYYNARDYSIYPSYSHYLDFLTEVFKGVHRITKEGRFLIVNTSPVIMPRVSRAHASKRYPIPFDLHPRLVQSGWEFIDDIIWLKPESSAKNRNAGFLQHRKPLAYKPNAVTEYLMVYRKQTDKLLDWNMAQYDRKTVEESRVKRDYETTNVWRVNPVSDQVHTAAFPLELCNRVISFYSYKGDLVFDPFAGSGTLGRAAMNLGRYFFLTEKESRFIERMREDLARQNLFAEYETCFLTVDEFAAASTEQVNDDYL